MNASTIGADVSGRLDNLRLENLRRLLSPRSIAVVGASSDPSKAGSQALKSLSNFPGTLVAVNPREREVQGFPCYPTLAALPEPVDLAIFAIPAQHCVKAAEEAAAAGVGGIFIISGGFSEIGGAGVHLQEQLARICSQTGLRLLGPNTSGFINPHQACVASFVPGVDRLRKGKIAVVAQSGGVNLTLSFLIHRLGAGLSLAVGLGNAVDVGTSDVVRMLADDPNTDAIALHLEGVPRGRELFDLLRDVTRRKPTVALIAGKSDIGEFAVSHTGNLMGSHQRTVAALTQAGVVVVDSTDALAEAAVVLSQGRLPAKANSGVALVTGQAGPGLLIVDGLKAAGLHVPEFTHETVDRLRTLLPPMTYVKNPVDTGRPGSNFPDVVASVANDEKIDAVLVFALSEPSVLDPLAALQPALAQTRKSILFGTLGMPEDVEPALNALAKSGIPAVTGPERLAKAAAALVSDSNAQSRLSRPRLNHARQSNKRTASPFNEDSAKQLLTRYGVDSPNRRLCADRDEAFTAFHDLRQPVVVKIVATDIAHKTEAGGVFLNVSNEASLTAALDAIALIPTSTPAQVLIEEMAPPGVELIVGGVRDPSWGPCVVVGLGGVMAEALADSAVRLAPIDDMDAAEMLSELRGRQLLDGFRGLPRCDRAAIGRVIIAVGNILLDHPDISELEINPLRVSGTSALALDALILADS
ncbi:acetate--CoA ligase family protein [Caballeronia sp. S22]|uniref:acetate--CoA ligase family protein n=1 Tax=Caballeronia sp. S22 TaxID=3137182 RepID=UPI0035306A5B